jgi:hypothetical protein
VSEDEVNAKTETLAQTGCRVIAVAQGSLGGPYTLLGLIGLEDPPHPDSKKLISALAHLGVRTKMVTRDTVNTAQAVAQQVGIGERVYSASHLRDESGEHLNEYDVFAGVYPEDKYELVKRFQASGHVIGIIMHYTNMYFGKAPESFDDTLWLTQINQAYGIRYGVEHWRRDMPRSMAATIWQYNDSWPGPTWSMTDYYRRFKAIQYQSKHFFAPILVSGIPDPKTGNAELHITSDRQKDVSGELRWFVTDMAGAVLKHGEMAVHIPARTSRLAHTLDLADLISSHGAANLLIWPEVRVGSRTVADNALFFGRPLELKFNKPQLAVHVSGSGQHYDLRMDANAPALWAFANVKDTSATYSDNFIAIRPGRTAVIHITLDEPMSPSDFHRKLEVRSIYDLAPDMRA